MTIYNATVSSVSIWLIDSYTWLSPDLNVYA